MNNTPTTDRIATDAAKAMAIITGEPHCPKCGSEEYNKRHHDANFLAPEATWLECDDCGHKTDPS